MLDGKETLQSKVSMICIDIPIIFGVVLEWWITSHLRNPRRVDISNGVAQQPWQHADEDRGLLEVFRRIDETFSIHSLV